MRFLFDGETYRAVRITGPVHNMLGLAIGKPVGEHATLRALEAREQRGDSDLSGEAVAAEVTEGLAEYNARGGRQFQIKTIDYSPADTPLSGIYKSLTIALLDRIESGAPFEITGRP